MALSRFGEGPFMRLVNVGWGGVFVQIDFTGPARVNGIRLRVIDPGGGEWRTFDPADAGEPNTEIGQTFNKAQIAPYRFFLSSLRADEVTLPGSGEITGWVDGVSYYPTQDVGSAAALFDRCLDATTGAYVGDAACEEFLGQPLGGGPPETGGVARHLLIQDIYNDFNSGDPFKRIRYSHALGSAQDPRIDFNDDPPPPEFDLRIFKAERAVVEGPVTDFRYTRSFLVNFSFKTTEAAGKPVTIRAEMEEAEDGGTLADSSVRFRRWSTPRFRINASPSGDGSITTYAGSKSPSIDVTRAGLTYGASDPEMDGNGEVLRFNRSGFVS